MYGTGAHQNADEASQKAHTAMIGSQGKAVGVALPIIAAATKNNIKDNIQLI
jgi:hypothetical protein